MAFLLTLISCVALLICACYYWIMRRYSFWKNKGIVSPKPSIPFGNIRHTVLGSKQIGVDFSDIYKNTKMEDYVGVYMVLKPTLVINNLDLIKTTLTKDFVHFSDHGLPFDEEAEPISGHLFNVGGAKWKNLRAKLTPTFTSSRMRSMFDVVHDCAAEVAKHLDQCTEDDLDVKEILAIFGNDVIASCAFGIELNTFKNPDDKFRKMGKRIFKQSFLEETVNVFDFFLPNVITKFKPMILGREVEEFFYNIVEQTVNLREKNGIVRNDFMQLLIQLKNTGSISEEGVGICI